MNSYISSIIRNTFGINRPDYLRPASGKTSHPIWGSKPKFFINPSDKEGNEPFSVPDFENRDSLKIHPDNGYRNSHDSSYPSVSDTDTENTLKEFIHQEKGLNNSLKRNEGYDKVLNEDKKEHKEVFSTQGYKESNTNKEFFHPIKQLNTSVNSNEGYDQVLNEDLKEHKEMFSTQGYRESESHYQSSQILIPGNEIKEVISIPEMPNKDLFKERLAFSIDDGSKTLEKPIFQNYKTMIKSKTSGEKSTFNSVTDHPVKYDMEEDSLSLEKPTQKRTPTDTFPDSNNKTVPKSARTEKQNSLESINKKTNSSVESSEKKITDLIPQKPALLIREIPDIIQTKLVVGKLIVEVINPAAEKDPSVQVKEINNYIPVPATRPSGSLSSEIKVKYGLGQL